MSTQLRNVPNCDAANKLTQTRFYSGATRRTCLQVTQPNPYYDAVMRGQNTHLYIQLTRHQAKELSVELMLFAEGREVEEYDAEREALNTQREEEQ